MGYNSLVSPGSSRHQLEAEWVYLASANTPLAGRQSGQVAEYAGHVHFLGLRTQLGAISPLSTRVRRR